MLSAVGHLRTHQEASVFGVLRSGARREARDARCLRSHDLHGLRGRLRPERAERRRRPDRRHGPSLSSATDGMRGHRPPVDDPAARRHATRGRCRSDHRRRVRAHRAIRRRSNHSRGSALLLLLPRLRPGLRRRPSATYVDLHLEPARSPKPTDAQSARRADGRRWPQEQPPALRHVRLLPTAELPGLLDSGAHHADLRRSQEHVDGRGEEGHDGSRRSHVQRVSQVRLSHQSLPRPCVSSHSAGDGLLELLDALLLPLPAAGAIGEQLRLSIVLPERRHSRESRAATVSPRRPLWVLYLFGVSAERALRAVRRRLRGVPQRRAAGPAVRPGPRDLVARSAGVGSPCVGSPSSCSSDIAKKFARA
mmetsp:Transcript_19726/g.61040  ORF Transcript_19726/g.61040 Transcript_19726/m.61040 type:complete len:365 (-) Transcript_19726:25-1119(-)